MDGIIIILKLIIKLMKLIAVHEAYAPCWSQIGLEQQGDTLINEKALELVLERMVIPQCLVK
ncbi:hypothetical protein HYD67_00935 [Mycoplasmopsis bovis]|nr:hypothetical protein [Mycoplasmopsis bovis]QQH54807.1 hypothetical protein HYD67_00935 [Mycoplasmopsis bovis]